MEDVTRLTKEEFLKFLNCSHHNTKPERIVIPGPRNSVISVVKRFGKYEADNVEVQEYSLNNQILRIPLPRVELQSLSPRQIALRFKTQRTEKKRKKNNVIVSRFGRRLKKKQLNIQTLTKSATNRRIGTVPVYSTKNPDKNKNRSKVIQPEIKKVFTQNPKPVKVEAGKFFSKRMDVDKLNIFQEKDQLKSKVQAKPHFIIKYVPSEPTYFLKMAPLKHPQDGLLKYSFDSLVKDIKNMKLPSPTWKIKVVVKSNKIASIIFTNKCVLERTVTFNAKSEFFEVVIENRPAILLGSPGTVSCIEDIEILLNIIHTISAKNDMVYYKNNLL